MHSRLSKTHQSPPSSMAPSLLQSKPPAKARSLRPPFRFSIARFAKRSCCKSWPLQMRNTRPKAVRELCPTVSMGDYERKSWASDSAAVVALIEATVLDENGNTINALTPSQIQSLLTQIGIAPPTEAEIAAIRAGAEASRQKQE